jgi:geranylgeranyl diphosphate synthase, type II
MENYTKLKAQVNSNLEKYLVDTHEKNEFKQMIQDSVYNGKRLRPCILLDIGHSINTINEEIYNIMSVVVEILHSCSLIIDDLPCMDNDVERRGKPTIHYKYGETCANILCIHMLTEGYNQLYSGLIKLSKSIDKKESNIRSKLIMSTIADNIGILGAAMGQYLDTCPLYHFIDNSDYKQYFKQSSGFETLIHKKTTTFFEISFVIGYLVAGGDIDQLDKVKQASKYFGLAFQISDDFEDQDEDKARINHEDDLHSNYVNNFGNIHSKKMFNDSIDKCKEFMSELGIWSPFFEEICEYIGKRVK